MSENNAPVIVRNDKSMTFAEQTFGKKSNNAGKKFFAPQTGVGNFNTDVDWFGMDWVVSLVNKAARNVFAGIYLDNLDEKTGEFNDAQWQLDAADFTAGIAKLSDLQDDLDELVGIQNTFSLDDVFGDETERGQELLQKVVEINRQIKPIRVQIASIKVKYQARADARKAKEEASKTSSPAPTE